MTKKIINAGTGRKTIPIPEKTEVEEKYNEFRSIRLCSIWYEVSSETFRTWLKLYEIPTAKQGPNNVPSNVRNQIKFGKRKEE